LEEDESAEIGESDLRRGESSEKETEKSAEKRGKELRRRRTNGVVHVYTAIWVGKDGGVQFAERSLPDGSERRKRQRGRSALDLLHLFPSLFSTSTERNDSLRQSNTPQHIHPKRKLEQIHQHLSQPPWLDLTSHRPLSHDPLHASSSDK